MAVFEKRGRYMMKENLLTRIRKLNWALSESASGFICFTELSNILYEVLDANVYIISRKGKVLAAKFNEGEETPLELVDDKTHILPKKYNDKCLALKTTSENLTYDAIKKIFGSGYELAPNFHTIVPVIFGGQRVATLMFVRESKAFSDEDIAICEYGATVVGMEVSRGIKLEEEADGREKHAVTVALETLSYSEFEALTKIFKELEGDEGLLVASKIADKSGITRSVIVNALRKLESAGVLESRSLGMKGTRIRITNSFLREEIEKLQV